MGRMTNFINIGLFSFHMLNMLQISMQVDMSSFMSVLSLDIQPYMPDNNLHPRHHQFRVTFDYTPPHSPQIADLDKDPP